MTVSILTFNGWDVQTGNYLALPMESLWSRAGQPITVTAPGRWPAHIRTQATPRNISLEIQITAGTPNDGQRELQEWFAQGTQGELILSDDGIIKAVDVTVIGSQRHSRGATMFTAMLQAADPRMRGYNVTTESATITASGQSLVVTNPGNITEDAPIITIVPRTAKAAASGYLYRLRSIVAWRAERESGNYPIELTENWDHATEVAAGRSQADGDDVRVMVNGSEVPRWFSEHADHDANDDQTHVWINLSLSPRRTAETLAAITATSPDTTGDLEVEKGGTADWPRSGVILVENEVILYSGLMKSNANGREAFTGITRGAWSTTAAAHSASTTMYWVEHEIEIIYGNTGASAPDARNDLKPMLDLTSTSTSNTVWPFLNFADESNPGRSAQWQRRLRTNDDQYDKILAPSGSPAANMTLEYQSAGAVSGKPNYNAWYLDIPTGTGASGGNVASITRTIADTLGMWVYGVDGSGSEIVLEKYAGALTVASDSITEPTNPVYRIECWAFNQVIARRPDATYVNQTALTATAKDYAQQFLVGEQPLDLLSVQIGLADTTGGATVTGRLYASDSDVPGTSALNDFGTAYTTTAAGLQTGTVAPSAAVTLQPTSEYWLGFDDAAGVTTFITNGFLTYTGGRTRTAGVIDTTAKAYDFRIFGRPAPLATSFVRMDTNCLADDSDQVVIDGATVYLSSTETPYVALQARESIYRLQGTLYNETTSQQITLDCVTGLNDSIEIDTAAMAALNVAAPEHALAGVVFSDQSSKFTLAPGDNVISFTETGVAGVDISLDYYGRYE